MRTFNQYGVSSLADATTTGVTACHAPTGLMLVSSVSAATPQASQFVVSWASPIGAQSCTLGVQIDGQNGFSEYAAQAVSNGGSSSSVQSWTVSGVTTGRQYHQFRVRATNAASVSTLTPNLLTCGLVPAVTLSVALPTVGSTSVTLSWAFANTQPNVNQPLSLVQYRLSTDTAGELTNYALLTANTTSCTISNLQPSGLYTFVVTGYNTYSLGQSNSVTHGLLPAPLTALTAGQSGATSIPLSWNSAAGATGYTLQYQVTSSNSGWTTTPDSPVSDVNYTLSGLASNTSYSIMVNAVGPYSSGLSQSLSNVKTLITPAPAGAPLSATSSNAQAEVLSWSASSTANVMYQATVTPGNYVMQTSGTSVTFDGLAVGTTYTASVVAMLQGVSSAAITTSFGT